MSVAGKYEDTEAKVSQLQNLGEEMARLLRSLSSQGVDCTVTFSNPGAGAARNFHLRAAPRLRLGKVEAQMNLKVSRERSEVSS